MPPFGTDRIMKPMPLSGSMLRLPTLWPFTATDAVAAFQLIGQFMPGVVQPAGSGRPVGVSCTKEKLLVFCWVRPSMTPGPKDWPLP